MAAMFLLLHLELEVVERHIQSRYGLWSVLVFITEDDFQLYRIVKLLISLQGSDETPGLAALAVAEILSMAEKAGKLISISSYEVYQDHVYDLLDPKRPEVMALEDARGKIQLKGLSQVKIYGIFEHFSFIKLEY